MSIIGSLLAYETSISDLRNPDYWMTDALIGRRTQAGESVNPTSAMSAAAYFACIRVISEDVGKLPLITYRRLKPRGKERLPDHPLYPALHDSPNPIMSAQAVRETITAAALGWGNGYAEIANAPGGGVRLWPLDPRMVTPRWSEDRQSVSYEVRAARGGPTLELPASRVIHIHGLGEDGLQGYSVASVAAESIGVALATQSFGASFFGHGTHLGGILTHPQTLSKKAKDNIRESMQELYQGPDKAHRLAIFEEGMKFEKTSIPPNDAQFLESRQFQTEEICRWFRMPPHKIQHLLRSTFSNIEHQSIEYVQDTLLPWLVRWEQELKRKLFMAEEDVFAEHLVTALLRGDQTTRASFYVSQFQIGVLSQNDIRELENMNPIENGDTYYVPLNMARSEDMAKDKEEEPEEEESKPPPQFGTPEEPDEEPEDDEEEEEEDEDGEEGGSGLPGMRDVLKPIFADAIQRLLRKESKAVVNRAKKHGRDSAAFGAWEEGFYAEHAAHAVEALWPACVALARIVGREVEELSNCVRGFVEEYVSDSQSRIGFAYLNGGINAETLETPDRVKDLTHECIERIVSGSGCQAACVPQSTSWTMGNPA